MVHKVLYKAICPLPETSPVPEDNPTEDSPTEIFSDRVLQQSN